MKKVYLHIGSPKTGSTAIQSFLSLNSKYLQSKNYFYPNSVYKFTNALGYTLLDFDDRPLSNIDKNLNNSAVYDQVKNEINSTTCENILISSEEFFFLDAKFPEQEIPKKLFNLLNEIKDIEEIKVVLYLKPQFDFFQSWYKHIVTNHNYTNYFSGEFEDFYAEYKFLLNYEELIQNWATTFGEGSIILREYMPDYKNDHQLLLIDFLQSIDVNYEFDKIHWPKNEVNKSTSNKTFYLLKEINKYQKYRTKEDGKRLIEFCEMSFQKTPQPSLINQKELEILLDDYKLSNIKISQKYLNGEPLFEKWNPNQHIEEDSSFIIEKEILFKLIANLLEADSNNKPDKKNRKPIFRFKTPWKKS